MEIITNNVPRLLIDACELTPTERAEFDYLDWDAIDAGEDSATFVRYRDSVLDFAEFTTTTGYGDPVSAWDGIRNDSFYSGVLIRMDREDNDYIVVGRYFS